MLEGEYLELCDQLKEKYDLMEKENEKIKQQQETLLKELISCYGMIRIIDNLTEQSFINAHVKTMIEILRSHLSDIFDNYSLVEEEDID